MTQFDSSFSGVRMVAEDAVTNSTSFATSRRNFFTVRPSIMRSFLIPVFLLGAYTD